MQYSYAWRYLTIMETSFWNKVFLATDKIVKHSSTDKAQEIQFIYMRLRATDCVPFT